MNDEVSDRLDEALEETFPASDAPANTVETGIAVAFESEAVRDTTITDRIEPKSDPRDRFSKNGDR